MAVTWCHTLNWVSFDAHSCMNRKAMIKFFKRVAH